MTPESSTALAEIRSLKAAMRDRRAMLFKQPWTLEKQSQIDDIEVAFYTQRLVILRALTPTKAATVIRHLSDPGRNCRGD